MINNGIYNVGLNFVFDDECSLEQPCTGPVQSLDLVR